MKKALLIAGMRSRWPVDIGSDKATLRLSDAARDAAYKASGIRTLDDVHGLCVFSEESPVGFPFDTGRITVLPNPKEFIDALVRPIEVTDRANDPLSAALALFNAARFELSPRAKFLTLIMAVESVAKASKRPDLELTHLRLLKQLTKRSQLDKSAKDDLINALGRLKQESINSACWKLICHKLGPDAAARFRKCYRVRSRLTHGQVRRDDDLAVLTPTLEQDVKSLLEALLLFPTCGT
jgi:hypothetical protein